MNPSSSSSISSSPLYKSSSRPHSSTTVNRETPSIIPLDYNYQIMAPSSLRPQTCRYNLISRSSTRQSQAEVDVDIDENLHYSSLFGDPVPPPPPDDFLTTTFTPTEYLRSPSNDLTSEEELITNSAQPQRLFSQVPYTNLTDRRYSRTSSKRNFEIMPSNIPRLKPPDIQILPNSSGGSSTEAQNSPNYLLLTPQDIIANPSVYEINKEATDISELKETYSVSDIHSKREFTQTMSKKSGTSGETPDMQILSPPQGFEKTFPRQFSNESYSSGEWFRSTSMDYPEFNKMPKLRPSSKNVMSIKRDEMPMDSPVAAMINDSNGSSSGEERLLEATQTLEQPSVSLDSLKPPERPPSPSPSCLRSLDETVVLTPKEYIKQRRKSIHSTQLKDGESVDKEEEEKPPPIPPKPQLLEVESNLDGLRHQTPLKRQISPVILKDSITTGSDFRVDQTRHHKKTSFTIISDKTQQSSRPQSPNFLPSREHTASSLIPTKKTTAKLLNRNQLQRKSLSSTQLKLPHLSLNTSSQQVGADDSPRPSVQFDMTGRYSPSKPPAQKGILQNKETLTAFQDTLLTQLMGKPISNSITKPYVKSCEALPFITDPYRTSIPRINRSALEMGPESAVFPPGALPRPLKPNPNPTRKQKGLLKVLNHEEILSRIPLKSNWSSMDDLWLERKGKAILTPIQKKINRRRSSSTSPSRRSSTQTTSDRRSSNLSTITTSDFSFRRPSVSAKTKNFQAQRKTSVFQVPSPTTVRRKSSTTSTSIGKGNTQNRPSRTKIAKPTTLSPIIGTPNKDSSSVQSSLQAKKDPALSSDSLSEINSRRDSLSKIPVRNEVYSRSTSRLSFHANSRVTSRSGSPMKDSQMDYVTAGVSSKGVTSMEGRTSQMAIHSRSGSPLKDYQEAAARLSQMTGERLRSDSQMSGIRSKTAMSTKGHTQIPTSRSGSRASLYLPRSQPGSRAQSQATSRAPSRSTSRASTRPISLPGSRPTSRIEQAKDILNSRSNSRLSIHSSKRAGSVSPIIGRKTLSSGRRKSVSLSPKGKRKSLSRRGSISPAGMKSRPSQRGRSRSRAPSTSESLSGSRIPVSHLIGRSSTKSPPTKKKSTTITDLRRTSSLKMKAKIPVKQPASAKKNPSFVRKSENGVKTTSSAIGKQGAITKNQTTSIQKPSSVKNEPSNVTKKSNITSKTPTREMNSSSVKKKPATAKQTPLLVKKHTTEKKSADKGAKSKGKGNRPEAKTTSTTTIVNAKDKHMNDETVIVSQEKEEKPHSSSTVAPAVAMLAGMKRQPSTVSLMRVSSKISLLKKRSDSTVSKKTLDLLKPEIETNEMEALSPTQHLAEMALTDGASIPAAILEKSQKTLENIQKTVTEATEEIQKTINENLTDLKSLEQDMGLTSDSAGSPTPSVTTVVEKKSGSFKQTGESVSRQGTAEGGKITSKSPLPPTQPIEAAVSVLNPEVSQTIATSAMSNDSSQLDNGAALQSAMATTERVSERAISVKPEVESESANFQSYQGETTGEVDGKVLASGMDVSDAIEGESKPMSGASAEADYEAETKRRSPDGQGGSQTGSGKGSDSQEYLEKKSLTDEEEGTSKGCCSCCAKFCMPCRRSRCSRCCQRKKSSTAQDEAQRPVLSATSSATTTHLEVVDEKQPKKTSCWQKLNCCQSCRKKSQIPLDSSTSLKREEKFKEQSFRPMGPPKQSKCGLCISKIFCCRSVNKIDPKTGDETEVKKCCFCIPCRRKRAAEIERTSAVSSVAGGSTAAWQDPEIGTTATTDERQVTESKPGCCKKFCNFLLCCRKKKVEVTDSRRPSIRAPPPEDTRRKLHADLVEYTSKMKGAIPVLPLWLAWFCAICNIIVPGLGTLLSGLFCLCVGIPRFSQYDSAKARLGSFIINTIVAVSQLFCVLFCFVGWGWSVWWGTIMLKCAKKLSKIRKVEKLEMEEEKRQAAVAAAAEAAAAAAVKTPATTGSNPEAEPTKS